MVDPSERAFKAFAPTWPTWLSDSEPAARKAWFALNEEEQEQASDNAQLYLAALRATGSNICSLAVYLKEKRWNKLTASEASGISVCVALPVYCKPYGKAWMARRLMLLDQPRKTWRPNAFQQAMLDQGKSDLVKPDRHRAEFPLVAELDRNGEQGRGFHFRPDQLPDHDHYVSTGIHSELYGRWARWHQNKDLPWINPPDPYHYVWLPADVPTIPAPSPSAMMAPTALDDAYLIAVTA